MKLVVIDGQGGGVGKSLVAALKARMPDQPVIALGTNVQATSAMLRAGADAPSATSANPPASSWALREFFMQTPCLAKFRRALPPPSA